jgi:predicted nucleic acid-binding protein
MNQILIDTKVLVYAHDVNEPGRQTRAPDILGQLQESAYGRLSVQSLAEFFSVATRKLIPAITASAAGSQVELLIRTFSVLHLTPAIVLEATRGVRDHDLEYWDAQIWAMAKLNQIPLVFSEDFRVGQSIEGIRFVNPFAPDFSIDRWVSL